MPWTPVQQKIQQWMAMPKELRPAHIKTKAALARLLKITPGTIYRWQNIIGWWDEVFKHARAQIGEDLSAILQAMVREAKNGDVRAAKLCLEALGVHADRLILEGTIRHDNLVVILGAEGLGQSAIIDGESRVIDSGGTPSSPSDWLKSSLDTSNEEAGVLNDEMVVFEELFAGPPAPPQVPETQTEAPVGAQVGELAEAEGF